MRRFFGWVLDAISLVLFVYLAVRTAFEVPPLSSNMIGGILWMIAWLWWGVGLIPMGIELSTLGERHLEDGSQFTGPAFRGIPAFLVRWWLPSAMLWPIAMPIVMYAHDRMGCPNTVSADAAGRFMSGMGGFR